MADGTTPEADESGTQRPWQELRRRGVGPVRCPRCKTPVPEAERGQHACSCDAHEPGCGPAARLRAKLGGVVRDIEELIGLDRRHAGERDALVLACGAWEQERDHFAALLEETAGSLHAARTKANDIAAENERLRAELAEAHESNAALERRVLFLMQSSEPEEPRL